MIAAAYQPRRLRVQRRRSATRDLYMLLSARLVRKALGIAREAVKEKDPAVRDRLFDESIAMWRASEHTAALAKIGPPVTRTLTAIPDDSSMEVRK